MTRKGELQEEWLDLAMQIYDAMDDRQKRELFQGTCQRASKKYTAAELERIIPNLKLWMSERLPHD